MEIKKLVAQLIKKYGTSNPFKLAEYLGIIVVFDPLGSIYGYYSRTHRIKVLHINSNLSCERQLSTCAHELGHALLHPDENTAFLKLKTFFSTDRIEVEANEFMVELLFSEKSSITIKEATELYGIPEQFLIKKIYH